MCHLRRGLKSTIQVTCVILANHPCTIEHSVLLQLWQCARFQLHVNVWHFTSFSANVTFGNIWHSIGLRPKSYCEYLAFDLSPGLSHIVIIWHSIGFQAQVILWISGIRSVSGPKSYCEYLAFDRSPGLSHIVNIWHSISLQLSHIVNIWHSIGLRA